MRAFVCAFLALLTVLPLQAADNTISRAEA